MALFTSSSTTRTGTAHQSPRAWQAWKQAGQERLVLRTPLPTLFRVEEVLSLSIVLLLVHVPHLWLFLVFHPKIQAAERPLLAHRNRTLAGGPHDPVLKIKRDKFNYFSELAKIIVLSQKGTVGNYNFFSVFFYISFQRVLTNLSLWSTEHPSLLVSCVKASPTQQPPSELWFTPGKLCLGSCLLAERKSSFLGGNGMLIVSLKFCVVPGDHSQFCLLILSYWMSASHLDHVLYTVFGCIST